MLLIEICVAIVAILLQIFLSKRQSKWPGVVLPSISFVIAYLLAKQIANNLDVLNERVMMLMAFYLLLMNIPTVVLAVIYVAVRLRMKRAAELDAADMPDRAPM
ncbi:hypothetical protein IZU99_04305 [Oscillospiraceae bacterium CM]|nr:hypothetical protein IZU99_04305 [Oscillospiraceae bacterium CM]